MSAALKVNQTENTKAPRFEWRDEADLGWFFSLGQSAFERSTFGDQLARAEAERFGEDGQEFLSKREFVEKAWDFEARRASRRPARYIPELTALRIVEKLDWAALDPTITAQPSQGQDHGEQGYTPDDRDLQRYAEISRTLSRLAILDRRVLSLFFGLRGGRYADKADGKIFILYSETSPGRKILATYPQRQEEHLTPDERLLEQWADQRARPDDRRMHLFRAAEQKAHEMLASAKAAYLAAKEQSC